MDRTETLVSRQTILVAESDILLRHVLAEYLRGCGFDVIEASSAQEAMKVVRHGLKIDLVFADARLSGRDDGFALAQWVRRARPGIRIVLTSTLTNKSRAVGRICGKGGMPDSFVRERLKAKRARIAGAGIA